jgi:hypothetical protein
MEVVHDLKFRFKCGFCDLGFAEVDARAQGHASVCSKSSTKTAATTECRCSCDPIIPPAPRLSTLAQKDKDVEKGRDTPASDATAKDEDRRRAKNVTTEVQVVRRVRPVDASPETDCKQGNQETSIKTRSSDPVAAHGSSGSSK